MILIVKMNTTNDLQKENYEYVKT